MTDFTYQSAFRLLSSSAIGCLTLGFGLTVGIVSVSAQDSDLQLNDLRLENGRSSVPDSGNASQIRPATSAVPFPSITEPQPESRMPAAPQAPSLFRGSIGASDSLFSGPIDPDTQDVPTQGGTSNGGGARVGLRRQGGEIQPGQRDDRRRTPDGRIVRRGQAGYETATPIDPQSEETQEQQPLFQTTILDTDIDPDLRESYDDDLLIRDSLLLDEPLTGPTVGASRLVRGNRTVPTAGEPSFTTPLRQAYPSIDDERPYDPLGIRMGSFRVLPTLTATTVVTDNVANAAGAARADIGAELRSTLRVESDWNRHSLSLDANAAAEFYNRFDDENSRQFAIAVRGRLDVTRRTNIELDAGYQLTTEDRGSADATVGAVSEPDVETLQAGATFNHRFNRLVSRTRVGYTAEINGDAQLESGGVDVGADEDFIQVDVASRLTYEFSPSFAAFVEGGYNRQVFDVGADADGILRDSNGYEVRVGTTSEIGPAIRAEISVGYATQISDDARLSDVEGFVFDADILWRPTALTSIGLTAQSEINSSTQSGSLGAIQYQTALNVRHEFRRYAIGTLGLGWQHENFQGSSITEDQLTFQLGGEYLFTRNLAALASYQFTDFSSSLPNSDYQVNEFRVGVQVRR